MNYQEALSALESGKKVKLPEWIGYWFKDNGIIKVFTRDCQILESPYLQDYTSREDWEETDGSRDFGGAIKALKAGRKVSRLGWNGKGLFIFKQIPANIGLDIIPKMQSVPQSVKDTMIDRSQHLNYRNQCVIVDVNGNVDNWAPSISDCFAEDWQVLD